MAKTIVKDETAKAADKQLPDALQKDFALVENFPTVFACELGEIDISKIDRQLAEQLAEKGYLKRL